MDQCKDSLSCVDGTCARIYDVTCFITGLLTRLSESDPDNFHYQSSELWGFICLSVSERAVLTRSHPSSFLSPFANGPYPISGTKTF